MMSLIALCTGPPAAYQLVECIGPLKIFKTYIKHLLINRTNCRAQTHCYCLLHNNLIVAMPCIEIIQIQIGIPRLTLLHSTNYDFGMQQGVPDKTLCVYASSVQPLYRLPSCKQ